MLTVLEGSKDNVLGIEVTGGYTKPDVEAFRKAFEDVLAKGHDKVHVLVKIDAMSFKESSFGAFVEDCRYSISYLKQLGRIAVVGNSDFEKFLVKVDNFLFGSPEKGRVEKYFDASQLEDAWAFVRG